MRVEKSAISSFLPHDFYDDDDSTDSDDDSDSEFDYFQQVEATKLIDLYDFVHDTDPYTPMDIPQEFDDE